MAKEMTAMQKMREFQRGERAFDTMYDWQKRNFANSWLDGEIDWRDYWDTKPSVQFRQGISRAVHLWYETQDF